jgi:hypothetical protein
MSRAPASTVAMNAISAHGDLIAGLRRWARSWAHASQAVKVATRPAPPRPQPLQAGVTAWVMRPFGQTISCTDGTLSLSFAGEGTVVVLHAGQSHCCTKASRLAIHALTDAAVRVN